MANDETTALLPESRQRAPADEPKHTLSDLRFFVLCISLYFGVFIAALDGTIVTSLLSHIASDLHELPRVSWIATGYLVACAAFQPLYGKLSDIYGRKVVLLFCTIMFGVGCLLCGIATDFNELVSGRVISGIGGGGMLSLSTIALSDFVPLRKRGVYQGIGNIAFGVGAGVGGVFGGIVSDVYDWRMAFTCQVPAVIVSAILVALATPNTGADSSLVPVQEAEVVDEAVSEQEEYGAVTEEAPQVHPVHYTEKNSLSRVDFWGSLTLVSSLMFLMLAIATGGRQYPWTHPLIIGFGLLGVIFAGLFAVVELYVAEEPVLPMQLLGHRTILASGLTNLFMTMSVYSILFFVPVCMQSVFNLTPTEVGERLVANFIGVAIGSFAAGIYMKNTGRYYILAVTTPLLYLVGMALVCDLSLFRISAWQYVILFLVGTGYAAMLTVSLLALIAAVPHEFQAVTTSMQYAFRGIGSTMGVSVSWSVFQNVLAKELYANVHGPEAKEVIERVLESVDDIRRVPIEYQADIIDSYASASLAVFYTALGLAFVSFITSACMKEHKLHSTISRRFSTSSAH